MSKKNGQKAKMNRRTKLEIILSTLKPEEWKALITFMGSRTAYHEAPKKLVSKLYKEGKNWIRLLNEPKKLHREVTGQKYVASTYKNITTAVSNALNDFFRAQKYEEDSYYQDFINIQIYRERYSERVFKKKLKELRKKLMDHSVLDIWKFYWRMQLEHYIYYRTDNTKYKNDQLSVAMEYLDLFYAILKIRYATELQGRANMLQQENSIRLLAEVLEEIEHGEFQDSVLHQIYAGIFQMISTDKSVHFKSVKKLFSTYEEQLSEWDKILTLSYLGNFCARKIRNRELHYYQESFDLYQNGLKNDYYLIDGKFEPILFFNISNTACNLQKHDWADDFITKNKDKIGGKHPNSVYHLAKARIHFEHGNFSAAQTLLVTKNNVEGDTLFSLQHRILELMIIYKLEGNSADLVDKIKLTAIQYKQHKKLSVAITSGFTNFMSIFVMILEREKKELIEDKLLTIKPLVYERWLIKEYQSQYGVKFELQSPVSYT